MRRVYNIDMQPLGKKHIDRHIRPLVVAMNELPGIKTISSCEGHDESQKDKNAKVVFKCSNFKSLEKILSIRLSDMMCRNCAKALKPLLSETQNIIELDYMIGTKYGFLYVIEIDIKDQKVRFAFIKLITEALKNISGENR